MHQGTFARIHALLNKAQGAIEDIKLELSRIPMSSQNHYMVKFECDGEIFESRNSGLADVRFKSEEEAKEAITFYGSTDSDMKYFVVKV